jgi:gliding motility-associated-like protein
MARLNLIRQILILFIWLIPIKGFGQCKITAPSFICIGNPGIFSIQTPSGSAVQSVLWDFGDGFTSTTINAGHLYSKPGTFKVKCLLKFIAGADCSDSMIVNVLNLPNSKFIIQKSDSCFNKNKICLKDSSISGGSLQIINRRLFLWGDGKIEKVDSTTLTNCHTYAMLGKFKITLEITDNKGCKNTTSKFITILPSVKADFTTDVFKQCGSTRICYTNSSDTVANPYNIYRWQFDNQTPVFSNFNQTHCFYTKISLIKKTTLKVSNIFGCNDSITQNTPFGVDTIPQINLILSDSNICFNPAKPIKASFTGNISTLSFDWYINGVRLNSPFSSISINPKSLKLKPDEYILKCIVTKGQCTRLYYAKFRVNGPIAKMDIYNKIQCVPKRKVFFVDVTTYTNPSKSSQIWKLEDPFGENCECYRAKNINKNQNCNHSKDWYHKHRYTEPKFDNKVTLHVMDSLTGCRDSIIDFVNTDACGMCTGDGGARTIELCHGETFLPNSSDAILPKKFSLDTGKTWLNFPSVINKPYLGLYGVMLIYDGGNSTCDDYGDDSIKISNYHQYDTFFIKDLLMIRAVPNPNFNYKITGKCSRFEVSVYFQQPVFEKNESVEISWGDGTKQVIKADSLSRIDTLKHLYLISGLTTAIHVSRYYYSGCVRSFSRQLNFGYNLYFNFDGKPCLRNNSCFHVEIYEQSVNQLWDNNNKYGTAKLYTGESKIIENDFFPCYQYQTVGEKDVKVVIESKDGCLDSASIKLFVSDLKAGITQDSRVFGCGEIKQLMDSSEIISPDKKDKITGYVWDYGNKQFNVTEKDPFISFSKQGNYEIQHIVYSLSGCTDTIKYLIPIAGPIPQFDIITDTLGCEPLEIKIKNRSKDCAKYYWRFGDETQNTILNSDSSDITFTYKKPGKYFIRLTGIDSFYNNTTKSIFYCQATFPEDSNDRHVVVSPYLNADFDIDTNVCVGQILNIKNKSDNRYQIQNWDFGDGNKKSENFETNATYMYTKSGKYRIILTQDYLAKQGELKCMDTAYKDVTVKGIRAGFEYERVCEGPVFEFLNTSTPFDPKTTYKWGFGQAGSPDNSSNEGNPTHDYGFNLGLYKVCLFLKDDFGCSDSMCKIIDNDYTLKVEIPNVFTPGVVDQLNDEYDIDIVGEQKYKLDIFNRWGQLVYQSNNDSENGAGTNWNGKFNNTGPECPEGTYFYIFEYEVCYGKNKVNKVNGTIALIR